MTYISNPQHRNSQYAQTKSQWVIPAQDEVGCFSTAAAKGWVSETACWGIFIPGGLPTQLGVSPRAEFDLYLAKFVVNQGLWHGYPVAHWLSPFDKPPSEILRSWVDNGYINRAKFAKIHKGKKCGL
jgi:hypothetical protein